MLRRFDAAVAVGLEACALLGCLVFFTFRGPLFMAGLACRFLFSLVAHPTFSFPWVGG
jgi:hypothetical protein